MSDYKGKERTIMSATGPGTFPTLRAVIQAGQDRHISLSWLKRAYCLAEEAEDRDSVVVPIYSEDNSSHKGDREKREEGVECDPLLPQT